MKGMSPFVLRRGEGNRKLGSAWAPKEVRNRDAQQFTIPEKGGLRP